MAANCLRAAILHAYLTNALFMFNVSENKSVQASNHSAYLLKAHTTAQLSNHRCSFNRIEEHFLSNAIERA